MFKKLMMSAVAATLVATPMIAASAEAQVHRETRTVVKQRPNGTVVRKTTVRRDTRAPRRWAKGQRFDRRYATNYRVVDYRTYRGRGLYAPPRGYRWVRSGNDAVLVASNGGVIRTVIVGAIR
jgi:Ni/Co efflux regulator RcnB